jgi:hypothetical protein
MKPTTRKEVQKLTCDPISFAMMMDNRQLEDFIAAFVSVLNKRKPDRGG